MRDLMMRLCIMVRDLEMGLLLVVIRVEVMWLFVAIINFAMGLCVVIKVQIFMMWLNVMRNFVVRLFVMCKV